jgi:hypothetical protein
VKVLLVYNPWNPRKPKLSHYDMKLRGSFEAAFENSSEHSYEVLHFGFEPDLIRDNDVLNAEILKKDFDVCMVAEEMHFHIKLDTAKKLGKKLFLNVWDTWISIASVASVNFSLAYKSPRVWGEHYQPHSMKELSEYCNILVTDYGYGEIYPNVYGVFNSVDTRYFNTNNISEKLIDVGHNGTLYIEERIKYAQIFQKNNINVNYNGNEIVNGGIQSNYTSDEQYANIFKNTKISLCFTDSIFGIKWKQRKGRVSEIASCGSFMLATNPEVFSFKNKKWFDVGIHYDSINEQDCVDKVRFYLNNPEKRETMAKAFHQKWMETTGPIAYWNQIFDWSKG